MQNVCHPPVSGASLEGGTFFGKNFLCIWVPHWGEFLTRNAAKIKLAFDGVLQGMKSSTEITISH